MLYITGSVVRKHPVMMYKRIRDPPRDVRCVIVGEAAEVTRHKTAWRVFVMGIGVMAPITHLIHFSGTLNTTFAGVQIRAANGFVSINS